MAQELKAEWGRSLPGDLLKCWPRDADGELVPPAMLTKCTGVDMDDVLLVNMLEAYGIPCLKNYPGDGQFGKIMLGMSGYGVEILVPETLLADAQALWLRGESLLAPATAAVYQKIRQTVPPVDTDVVMYPQMAELDRLVKSGALLEAAEQVCGRLL